MNQENLIGEIEARETAMELYVKEYDLAVKYDDYGAREHNAAMILHCQRRIDEIEKKMTRKGA